MGEQDPFKADENFSLEAISDYREVCIKIAKLALEAGEFPASGHAASMIDQVVAYARRAHAISGHRMGMGGTFMDMPEANIFRFREIMQLEHHNTHVAAVRGRNSPFLPADPGIPIYRSRDATDDVLGEKP